MKYTPTDVEKIFRSAISNAEWAEEMFARLIPYDPEGFGRQNDAHYHLSEAIHYLNKARDEWRKQLNTGDIHGDFPSQR